jgi:hypothetical protein
VSAVTTKVFAVDAEPVRRSFTAIAIVEVVCKTKVPQRISMNL